MQAQALADCLSRLIRTLEEAENTMHDSARAGDGALRVQLERSAEACAAASVQLQAPLLALGAGAFVGASAVPSWRRAGWRLRALLTGRGRLPAPQLLASAEQAMLGVLEQYAAVLAEPLPQAVRHVLEHQHAGLQTHYVRICGLRDRLAAAAAAAPAG